MMDNLPRGAIMAVKRFSTEYPGVRFKQHPTRKHGVRFDRYFSVYFRLNGKLIEEGLGWASAGWTAQKAAGELAKLKENQRLGQSGQTLREKREIEQGRRKAEETAKEEQERDSLTFSKIFGDFYYPHAQTDKSKQSWKREEQLFRLWAEPVIGHLTLKQIAESDLCFQKIRKNMVEGRRANGQLKANMTTVKKEKDRQAPASPRSVHYCMAVIRQVFNYSKASGFYSGDNPVKGLKERKTDNKRFRFLSHEEAEQLLEALRIRSLDVRDMALLSLDCGLRFGEIAKLTWADIDTVKGMMVLRDTKSGKTRFGYMTNRVKEMLTARSAGLKDALVFPGKKGKAAVRITNTFEITVKQLGLNEGIADERQKVVFHTLRHTYASWLVQNGVNLYTVQKLLGHSTISQTERYSHLAPSTLQDAVKVLEAAIESDAGERKAAGANSSRQGIGSPADR
jgi:integrase